MNNNFFKRHDTTMEKRGNKQEGEDAAHILGLGVMIAAKQGRGRPPTSEHCREAVDLANQGFNLRRKTIHGNRVNDVQDDHAIMGAMRDKGVLTGTRQINRADRAFKRAPGVFKRMPGAVGHLGNVRVQPHGEEKEMPLREFHQRKLEEKGKK